jgi:hypothetical protein
MGNKQRIKETNQEKSSTEPNPKVMLMGCGNDGKSTIYRQIQKINQKDMESNLEIAPSLLKNLLKGVEATYYYFCSRGISFENHQIQV